MTHKLANLSFDDFVVGRVYSFDQCIDEAHVHAFAEVTGDVNPLHVDRAYGAQTPFGKNIVHGMLLGSLFSTLVGMYCPGERALYVAQTLDFRSPVMFGETVMVRGTILQCVESVCMIVLKTEIVHADGSVAVSGEARVRIRS